jgi:hypothetical protein
MIPIAVMSTVGTSDASMKMRRARCRKIVVGERCITPLLVCQTPARGVDFGVGASKFGVRAPD